MKLEWDERKRRNNLAKHGIDFEAARQIFEGRFIERANRRAGYGERLMVAYGEIDGVVLCVVYTRREQRRRVISVRRAIRSMTEEEIESNAASDPDNPPLEEGFMREGRTVCPGSPRWEVIELHLDADILEWFRARRLVYQDEINEALRAYMEAHRDEG